MTEFKGIQGFDISTSAYIFNPEKLFKLTDRLNQGKGESEWVGIELYPVQERKVLGRFSLPPVSVDTVHQWQYKYNQTKVSRVHLEFAYDEHERKFMIEKGDFHRSRISPIQHKILYHYIRQATSGYGIDLASALGVGANMHTNVALGLIKTGQLGTVRERVKDLIVENSINYNSPVEQGPILYDPEAIIDGIVEKHGFKKFLLGVDHLIDYFDKQGIDPMDVIKNEKVRHYTVALHIANPGHGPIKIGDPCYQKFFETVAGLQFEYPLRVVFDYSPVALLRYPLFLQQVRLFEKTIKWIQGIQDSAR